MVCDEDQGLPGDHISCTDGEEGGEAGATSQKGLLSSELRRSLAKSSVLLQKP